MERNFLSQNQLLPYVWEKVGELRMSVDVRYITNGEKTGYYVRNAGVAPTTIDIYEKKEDVPESIRHYCPDGEPKFWGPDMARIMGCQKLLYPNFPKECGRPEYVGKNCIAESCKYAPDEDWTKCPHFQK